MTIDVVPVAILIDLMVVSKSRFTLSLPVSVTVVPPADTTAWLM